MEKEDKPLISIQILKLIVNNVISGAILQGQELDEILDGIQDVVDDYKEELNKQQKENEKE